MKSIRKKAENKLQDKQGMTLVEVLVAMAILMVALITFLPLAQSSFQNIALAGKRIKEGYYSVGVIEKLIGNDGANGAYETVTANMPLEFHSEKSGVTPLKANDKAVNKDERLQTINGHSIISTPEAPGKGFSTFICNSVTAQMVAFPRHISDDFMRKAITLYGVGFHFSGNKVGEIKLFYTDESGVKQEVSDKYYKFTVEPSNSAIGYLTLMGDNDQISFTHSPLYIQHELGFEIKIEIDAPTVIMVGEAASDNNYYYYVTSGEPLDDLGRVDDEHGELQIVRKVMNNRDPKGSLGQITLNSAMNDVEWVGVGEGNNGQGFPNKEGYYHMCGDNGQIRRFWKNEATGNYGWGGDYVTDYKKENGETKITSNHVYASEVQSSYFYQKPTVEQPGTGGIANKPNKGIDLNPPNEDIKNPQTIYNRLYAQTVFSVNALEGKSNVPLHVSDTSFFMESIGTSKNQGIENRYTNSFGKGSWFQSFSGISEADKQYNLAHPDAPMVNGIPIKPKAATHTIDATQIESYESFNELDQRQKNPIVLTSVDSIMMEHNYTNKKYPQNSYTLYCGYIPAVMDLWATDEGVRNNSPFTSEWRGTLGLAYKDNGTEDYHIPLGKILSKEEKEEQLYIKHGGLIPDLISSRKMDVDLILNGHIWDYSKTKENNFAISGLCGPENYNKERCPGLFKNLTNKSEGVNSNVASKAYYPLNIGPMQLQNETEITVSYLSHPYAISGKRFKHSIFDHSPSRWDIHSGVFEWTFDDSLTISDSDTIRFVSYDKKGNETVNYISMAVGYTVSGLVYENQTQNDGYKELAVPTVMNNGVVLLRAGGKDAEGLNPKNDNSGVNLRTESNVFNQFFSTGDYFSSRNKDHTIIGNNENSMHQAVSAGYWRDVYHPLFYAIRDNMYDRRHPVDRYSYLMGHILQDKRLNCVCWGERWNGDPEAMWGASDGTMMDWNYWTGGENSNRIDAEFQSYQKLKYANEYKDKWGTELDDPIYDDEGKYKGHLTFKHSWTEGVHGATAVKTGTYTLPISNAEMSSWYNREPTNWKDDKDFKTHNPMYTNTYLDKRSLILATKHSGDGSLFHPHNFSVDESILKEHAFISPLDTVEDLEYANDTWVAVGVQGLANPIKEDGITYCSKGAVKQTSSEGSWVCVRTWYDQSGGKDKGPTENNCNYIWHAVQISDMENCNITQISYSNGMWYAMGYIDENDNGEYDYTGSSIGKEREHAVLFYARDPSKPCAGNPNEKWDGGWRLCNPAKEKGKKAYTRAWTNKGNDTFELLDIDGINSVASRND